MEENFSMEWNMEWKIFGIEWKWNGSKLPVSNMEKSSSILFYTMPWLSARKPRKESPERRLLKTSNAKKLSSRRNQTFSL